jgi:hypothetical protein
MHTALKIFFLKNSLMKDSLTTPLKTFTAPEPERLDRFWQTLNSRLTNLFSNIWDPSQPREETLSEKSMAFFSSMVYMKLFIRFLDKESTCELEL